MSVQKTTQKEKDETVAALDNAQKNADRKGPPVNNMGAVSSEKSKDQGGAAAMNAEVAADVEKQESEAATADPDNNEDDGEAGIEQDAEEVAAKKMAAEVAKEEEIERRAQARFDELVAAMPTTVVPSVAEVIQPYDHKSCCKKLAVAIEGILAIKGRLPDGRKSLSLWMGMLEKVLVKARAGSNLPGNVDVPDGRTTFGKTLSCVNGTARENQIYTNELHGHCMNLIEVSDQFNDKKWRGAWVGFTKTIVKSLG